MLFIQSLDTYYHNQERSSEYARLRAGDEFRKMDCSQIKECEVFAQLLRFGYGDDGRAVPAKLYSETYKAYGQNIFTEGTRDRYDNYNRLLKFIRIFKAEEGYKIMFCDEKKRHLSLRKINMEGSRTTIDTSIRTVRIGIMDGMFIT